MSEQHDPRHPRASARWAGRLAVERNSVTLTDLAHAVRALRMLDDDPSAARRALITLATHHDINGVAQLLGRGADT